MLTALDLHFAFVEDVTRHLFWIGDRTLFGDLSGALKGRFTQT
jgi:hypothetical protein